jgi:hypothetical protein
MKCQESHLGRDNRSQASVLLVYRGGAGRVALCYGCAFRKLIASEGWEYAPDEEQAVFFVHNS